MLSIDDETPEDRCFGTPHPITPRTSNARFASAARNRSLISLAELTLCRSSRAQAPRLPQKARFPQSWGRCCDVRPAPNPVGVRDPPPRNPPIPSPRPSRSAYPEPQKAQNYVQHLESWKKGQYAGIGFGCSRPERAQTAFAIALRSLFPGPPT